jgi:uncharacterized repeat protein (TIGR04052 family)
MSRLPLLALVLAACDGGHMMPGGEQAFTLRFKPTVGSEPFSCTRTYAGVGKSATTFTPMDFRLYVHDLKLVHHVGEEADLTLDQDGKWQYQNVALLDFEDKTGTCATGTTDTNMQITGKAAAGTYTGVHFKVGVPFELNHKDIGSAPSPLNLSTMYWAWNGGYKFTHIEGKSTGQPFIQIHIGSTGCAGGLNVTSCARPNRADVTIMGLDPASSDIVLDLGKLFADNDLDKNVGTPGCQGDAADSDCAGIFKNLGVDLVSGAPAGTQTFFRTP